MRIDFYINDGKVIFGEFTFTPGAALNSKILPEADAIFGNKIQLNIEKRSIVKEV